MKRVDWQSVLIWSAIVSVIFSLSYFPLEKIDVQKDERRLDKPTEHVQHFQPATRSLQWSRNMKKMEVGYWKLIVEQAKNSSPSLDNLAEIGREYDKCLIKMNIAI